jgi:hypothetical protein
LIFANEANPVYASVEMFSKAYIDEECDCGNDKYKWQFFGPPVHSFVLNPYDIYLYGSAVRIYDEAKQTTEEGKQWTQLINNSTIEKFKGYEITQPAPKTILFEGRLVNDNLSTGELPVTDGSYYKGWHLLSNPYTAAISVEDIVFGTGMEQTVYLYTTGSFNDWRNNAGDHGSVSVWNDVDTVAPGQYLAIPKNIAGFSSSTAVIPSMQGFMVAVSNRETPPLNGKTVNFAYGNLTANTMPQRVRGDESQTSSSYVYSVVTIAGGEQFDRVWLFTDEQCSASFDNGWDGRKLISPAGTLQIYASQSKDNFQIHATDDINGTNLVIRPVEGQKAYTLHFSHTNIETVYEQLLLVDVQTGTVSDVTADGSTYTFIANVGDVTNRFKLITKYDEPGNDGDDDINILIESQRLFLNNNSQESGTVRVYNLSGRMLFSLPFEASNVTPFQVELPKGIYLVRAETENRKVTLKAIVN